MSIRSNNIDLKGLEAMDLKYLETSGQPGGVDPLAGRGWVVNRVTGKTVMVAEPWRRRVQYMARRLNAWVEAWWPEVDRGWCFMLRVGLTLAPGQEYRPRLISDWVRLVKREVGKAYLDHFFVTELQERGAVHWHCCVVIRRGGRLEMPDKSGSWPWGSSSVKVCRQAAEAKYMARYWSKEDQKGGRPGGPSFPRGLRMFGHGNGRGLPAGRRFWFRLHALPTWLREMVLSEGLGQHGLPIRTKCNYWRKDERFRVSYQVWGKGWWFNGRTVFSPWYWSKSDKVVVVGT